MIGLRRQLYISTFNSWRHFYAKLHSQGPAIAYRSSSPRPFTALAPAGRSLSVGKEWAPRFATKNPLFQQKIPLFRAKIPLLFPLLFLTRWPASVSAAPRDLKLFGEFRRPTIPVERWATDRGKPIADLQPARALARDNGRLVWRLFSRPCRSDARTDKPRIFALLP
jgi:hypothetical protein